MTIFEMTLTDTFAKEHVEKWINAWNNQELDTLLEMYSDEVQFSSPKVKIVFPDRKSSQLSNKKELEEYWTRALREKYPNLKFEAKEVIVHNDIIVLEYFASLNGIDRTLVIEKFEFKDNKITRSSVFYGAEVLRQ
jgi:ketosteroid isomerase-like protein